MKLLPLCFLLFVFTQAGAVPPGMIVEYNNNALGVVIFSGEVHADSKLSCDSCHPKLFQQKKNALKMSLDVHYSGKAYCFSCHNGVTAFKALGQCERCHQQKK